MPDTPEKVPKLPDQGTDGETKTFRPLYVAMTPSGRASCGGLYILPRSDLKNWKTVRPADTRRYSIATEETKKPVSSTWSVFSWIT